MQLSFEPSAARGAALDLRMRNRLADTLDYVFGTVGGDLEIEADEAAKVVESVRRERQSPSVFGAYYEMVLALEDDELAQAREHSREIVNASPVSGLRVAAIEDRPRKEIERFRRMFLDDETMTRQPDPPLLEDAKDRIRLGFELLDRGFPEMSAEVRELLSELVIAAGPVEPGEMTFDGVSAYMLWGAVMLNARGQATVLDTAQALAHESGHNLLFGFCASGSLIENDDEELFSSPLRADPRPMDGVVHATYVTARMHQTVERLLQAGVLNPEQTEAARLDLDLHRRNFATGDEVIREGGRLTALGLEVMESARDFMAAAAA